MIEKRRFGRIGHMSTAAIFGAVALKNVSQSDADRALETVGDPDLLPFVLDAASRFEASPGDDAKRAAIRALFGIRRPPAACRPATP